jgi:hypothetical protein
MESEISLTTEPRLLSYEECQNILANHFFKCENAVSEVRLYLEDSELENLIDGGINTLVRVIGAECDRRGFRKITDLAESFSREWRDNYYVDDDEEALPDVEAPCPHILPILVLLVYAVYFDEEDYHPHAYYGKLNDLLEGHDLDAIETDDLAKLSSGTQDSTHGAWKYLSMWCEKFKLGSLGYFRGEPIGGKRHIGYLLRQALLGSSKDKHNLRVAFQKKGLRPELMPNQASLFGVAISSEISPRMKRILRKWPGDLLAREILGEVRDVFNQWEYSSNYFEDIVVVLQSKLKVEIRGKNFINSSFQIALPDAEIDIEKSDLKLTPGTLDCPDETFLEHVYGTNYANIVDKLNGDVGWSKDFDWLASFSYEGKLDNHDVKIIRRKSEFVILKQDVGNNKYSFIEITEDEIEPGQPYYLVTKENNLNDIKDSFVSKYLNEWLEDVLPGDHLIRPFLASAEELEIIEKQFDPVIRLVGGIRGFLDKNKYLLNALPKIVLEFPGKDKDDLDLIIDYYGFNGQHLARESNQYGNPPISLLSIRQLDDDLCIASIDESEIPEIRAIVPLNLNATTLKSGLIKIRVGKSFCTILLESLHDDSRWIGEINESCFRTSLGFLSDKEDPASKVFWKLETHSEDITVCDSWVKKGTTKFAKRLANSRNKKKHKQRNQARNKKRLSQHAQNIREAKSNNECIKDKYMKKRDTTELKLDLIQKDLRDVALGTTELFKWSDVEYQYNEIAEMPCFEIMKYLQLAAENGVSWTRARRDMPTLAPNIDYSKLSFGLPNQLLNMHSLGILEVVENKVEGLERVVQINPQLVLSPYKRMVSPGKFVFECLLVGCWLPDQLKKVKRYADKASLRIDITLRQHLPLSPPRISICTQEGWSREVSIYDRFAEVAKGVGVEFQRHALLGLEMSSALGEIDQLESENYWKSGTPHKVSWDMQYFDPINLSLSMKPIVGTYKYELWECKYQKYNIWRHYLIDKENDCHCLIHDRQLARWFVRVKATQASLPVCNSKLILPIPLKLPRVMERAICISTGFLPEFTNKYTGRISKEDRSKFAIPDSKSNSDDVGGIRPCPPGFFSYSNFYKSVLWPENKQMPLIGMIGEEISLT